MPTKRAKLPTRRADLPQIFHTVTEALVENQRTLDQADSFNQNHGSNMVQTFQTITEALEKKQGSSDSAALAYAAKTLSRQANSGSSQLYAEHLNQAAKQFKGKKAVDERGALQLLQMLIGSSQAAGTQATSQQAAASHEVASDALLSALMGGAPGGQGASQGGSSAGGDLLGSLLGGLTGGEGSGQGGSSAGGDLLGTLLGTSSGTTGEEGSGQSGSSSTQELLSTLLGGLAESGGSSSANQQEQSGSILPGLLSAGLAFMQAKQGGKDNFQALVQAILAGSGMGDSKHRTQSTEVVVESYLNAMGGKKTR